MNTTVKDVMTTRVIWVTKDATFRLGERDLSFRYRALKAFFAESP